MNIWGVIYLNKLNLFKSFYKVYLEAGGVGNANNGLRDNFQQAGVTLIFKFMPQIFYF